MERLGGYVSSDSSESENDNNVACDKTKNISAAEAAAATETTISATVAKRAKVDTAPEVDITTLQVAKQQDEIARFEKETIYDRKQNHLTGFI